MSLSRSEHSSKEESNDEQGINNRLIEFDMERQSMTAYAYPKVGTFLLLLRALLLHTLLGVGDGGVVVDNRSNETSVAISVYDGRLNMVLEIGLLDAGSTIDWDAKSIAANYSSPWKSSPPVPAEHLFVIKNLQDNSTITSQYFSDGASVTVVDDSIGGLSIKAEPSRSS